MVKSDSEAGAKLRTKEKQVPKSKTSDSKSEASKAAGEVSDSEAGAKLRTKTVSTSHETNLNVLIIVAGGLAWFLFR